MCSNLQRDDSIDRRKRVIVIGAGAAGIAAAARLLEHGFTNVLILEAENRIGGRIHSEFIGDAYVDLGAEEVHGQEGNVVAEIAEGFLRKKKPLTESICYYSDGYKLDSQLTKDVMHLIEEFCEENIKIPRSIGEVFIERFMTSPTLSKYKQDLEVWKKISDFLRLCESFFCILEGPFTWQDVVLESASHYVNCAGDQFMGFNGRGCKIVLDILMKTLSNVDEQILIHDKILLNRTVDAIYWDNGYEEGLIKVTCRDGSSFYAEHVIFTPSAAVLRARQHIFQPSLPPVKKEALKHVSFGTIMKIVLKFSTKWWSSTPIGFVWSKESMDAIYSDYIDAPTMDGQSCVTAIQWLIGAPDNDQVLIALATGPATIMLETMTNDQIKNGVMFVIRKFLGKYYYIPNPVDVLPTRWFANPNFGGVYSFETVEASKLDVPFQKVLEEPLLGDGQVPVILFAGEATHLTQYSTVNGAILSGYREADRLIELYKDE
ncbi:hypothetical protein WA026_007661 [Henosepilachna vigintioctopunctata]|uniref:Amine oxidase domain-containing protein n=1 Tax=Henosepilachna vigintioctopunctata TaxID=420089 RepID=A0AAW1U577_9CUCU